MSTELHRRYVSKPFTYQCNLRINTTTLDAKSGLNSGVVSILKHKIAWCGGTNMQ